MQTPATPASAGTTSGRGGRPEVTVIVPARDVAPYLGDALESLAHQDVAPDRLEVLVVDDGSTDETAAVAESMAGRLPGLKVLHHATPHGLAASRNHALAEARGEHIAFLDADDWLWPGTLGAAVATRIALDVDFVVIDQVLATGHSRTPRRAPEHRRGVRLDPRGAILPADRTTMVNYPNPGVRVCHRRLLAAGLLAFDTRLRTAEDRPWAWRLHLEAHSFAVAEAGCYGYRRGVPGALTAATDARQLDIVAAYEQIVEMVSDDDDGFLPKAVRDLFAVLAHHLGPDGPLGAELRSQLAQRAEWLVARLDARVVSEQLHAVGRDRADLLRAAGVTS